MALEVIIDGPALVKVDTGTSNALEELGYTMNGAEVQEQIFTYDVKTDEKGGDAGPPVDVQYMGEVHVVHLTLTKYDEAVVNKIRPRLYGGTAGVEGTPGTLMFAKSFRLLIASTNRPRNYLRAIFREPQTVNKGTKYSQCVISATCYPVLVDSVATLYNSTTT